MSEAEAAGSTGVAVIGMALRFPGANTVDEYWRNLKDGVESITALTDHELLAAGVVDPAVLANPNYVKAAAMIEGAELFDASFFDLSPREAEIIDPQQRLFLECAWEALESAGYDSHQYEGAIGVFAGAGMNTYLLYNIAPNIARLQARGGLQLTIGNDKDFLATRVSYKLDLKGPSVNIQTACSTSLVAVSVACQSLIDFQSDMVLAGGVTVQSIQKTGYLFEEGGITSLDGHCRAFDARSGGTVFGNGLGIVVLKRLQDALDDRDRIYAVIRGWAVNNDGSAKIGYTAPSVDGQAAVIAEALSMSGVDPETLGYVEAHGTGTPLGDPIEIAALNKSLAKRTKKKGFCAIGSVKTNFGHLDTAAGIAGLIKTVLALNHKTLPASLHFERANPQIDLDNSPFYLNSATKPWPAGTGPRRAGVSSFGIGGTNAHVIVEEAPGPRASVSSRDWHVLLLSARSANALAAKTRQFAEFLRANPDVDLCDVAFTLQVGRRAFPFRKALVCNSVADAADVLVQDGSERMLERYQEAADRGVAFMFPGQGTQYVNMGRELYDREPAFHSQMDSCAELLKPLLGLDLRTVLYPEESRPDEAGQLNQTVIAQPALFAIEYSLARTLMGWGISPRAMIGHSIGELVAACLANVLSFNDALRLVAVRGRLMQNLPPGAMLAVNLPVSRVEALIDSQLSMSAINAPGLCVVSGAAAAVDAFEQRLSREKIESRQLHTSHAFHSHMMEPVVAGFEREVRRIKLKAPSIPFISNVTGDWITAEQAVDPSYWANQLRATVLFSKGVSRLMTGQKYILLEVGPGKTLSTLTRRQDNNGSQPDVISTIQPAGEQSSDVEYLLIRLGQLWLAGARIDWKSLHSGEELNRLTLPTYPFERQRHWIDSPRWTASKEAGADAGVGETGTAAPGAAASASGSEGPPGPAAEDRIGTQARRFLPTLYVAPRNPLEERLAGIWEHFLGIEKIGIHDDFLELGGHSILGTQLVALLREEFQIDLPLRLLFAAPTVAKLAAEIEPLAAKPEPGAAEARLPQIIPDREHRDEPFPLTDVQQAYWVGRSASLELGNIATHVYFEWQSAALDLDRLQEAWRKVIERHDMLRAIVMPSGLQRILPQVPEYEIQVLDLRTASEAGARDGVQSVRDAMSHQVFETDQWPLFEIRASILPDQNVRLHVSFDLLIGDAWSFQVLGRDIAAFYANPEIEIDPLEVSFRDYVLAELSLRESEFYGKSQEYWWKRLPGLPSAPELPLAKTPASIERPRFTRMSGFLDRDRWERLKARGRQIGVTPSGILLAAYGEVLAAWGKSQRFTINLTLFNRLPMHTQVNDVVGDFTSLTLLEVDNSRRESFEQRARRLQQQLWDDLDHRYVGAVSVLRDLAKSQGGIRATVPIVFTSELGMELSTEAAVNEGGARLAGQFVYGISQTPQVWLDHQVSEVAGALYFDWDSVEELFPEGMVQDMFGAFQGMIERLAEDEDAWSELAQELMPVEQAKEREQVNATAWETRSVRLEWMFEEQVKERPKAVAVVDGTTRLSYDEVNERAASLGRRLRKEGARRNSLVGVVMDKGWEQVVGVMGILKSGAAYLPISADLPGERIWHLMRDGAVQVVVTQSWLDDRLEWPEGMPRIRVDKADWLGGEGGGESEEEGERDQNRSVEDLAYVIYTSGSTGKPKGVMISHRAAANTIQDINARYGVGPDDRVLAISSLSFDLSVYDIFGMLGAGGAVVMPGGGERRDAGAWVKKMVEEQVTVWNTVPQLMEMLVEYMRGGDEGVAGIRLVLLSGDWVPVSLPGEIQRALKGAQVVSMGGATEAAIWSILHEVREGEEWVRSVPYGKPMRNQRFEVLNQRLERTPVWVTGELYIGGVGLAAGYWGDQEKTGERFVEIKGERLYRTGDLGKYLPGGEIEFLGREDNQVKVGGHRIELGEVEAALAEHQGVKAAVVTAAGGSRENKRLIAYVVPDPAILKEVGQLREFLQAKLPNHMVPAQFVSLDKLPLSYNGKVNRRLLPGPDHIETRRSEHVAPRTPVEKALAAIFSQALGVDAIGIDDDFFALGGDSLDCTKAIYQIRKSFQVEVPIRRFFETPRIAELAIAVEEMILDELERIPAEEVQRMV
jgi:amino acid adenylation domain-containing protein